MKAIPLRNTLIILFLTLCNDAAFIVIIKTRKGALSVFYLCRFILYIDTMSKVFVSKNVAG